MLSGTDCLVRTPLCEILLNLQTLPQGLGCGGMLQSIIRSPNAHMWAGGHASTSRLPPPCNHKRLLLQRCAGCARGRAVPYSAPCHVQHNQTHQPSDDNAIELRQCDCWVRGASSCSRGCTSNSGSAGNTRRAAPHGFATGTPLTPPPATVVLGIMCKARRAAPREAHTCCCASNAFAGCCSHPGGRGWAVGLPYLGLRQVAVCRRVDCSQSTAALQSTAHSRAILQLLWVLGRPQAKAAVNVATVPC